MGNIRFSAAAKALEETLQELNLPESSLDLADFSQGRRAALLAASESLWGKYLGPLLRVEDVQLLLRSSNPEAVSSLTLRGQLLALDVSGGRKVYPAFQFSKEGRPFPELPEVLRIFEGAVETPYTIASWMVTPQPLLDAKSPAAWMQEGGNPELLFEAARRAAWRLAQ
jgi:hypothetical protein